MAFWTSFLPETRRRLLKDGIHLEKIRYWSDPTLTVSGHIVGVAGSRTLMISVCYALRAASSSEIS
jgi:hypothetical protein